MIIPHRELGQARPYTEAEARAFVAAVVELDLAYRDLLAAYKVLADALVRGAAGRSDVVLYNLWAVRWYAATNEALSIVRAVGVPGTADKPPFPPLFVQTDGQLVQPDEARPAVTTMDTRVFYQHPQAPDLVPANGALAAGPLIVLGILGGAAIIAYFTKEAVVDSQREVTTRFLAKVQMEMFRLRLLQIQWRALERMKLLERCIASAEDRSVMTWARCVGLTEPVIERTPAPPSIPDVLRALSRLRAAKTPWWVWALAAVGVVGAVGTGVYIYRRRRRAA